VGSRTILTHDYQNLDTSLAASHQLPIPENLGTPGAVNSVTLRQIARTGSENLGPVIWRVRQTPVVPAPNTPVTVTARLRPPDVARFVLDYEVRGSAGRLLADATTEQVVVNAAGELLVTLPGDLRKLADGILEYQKGMDRTS